MAPVIRRHLGPDARAQVGDLDGRLLLLDGRVQQLRARALGQVHADRRARTGLPAPTRGAHARDPQAPRQDPGKQAPTVGASATTPSAPRSCSPARTRPQARASTCSSLGTPPVPDATELELTAQELRDAHNDSILDTEFHRGRAVLVVNPRDDQGGAGASPGQGLHDAREPARRRLLPRRAAPRRALRDARPPSASSGSRSRRGSRPRIRASTRSSTCSLARISRSARSTTCSAWCSRAIPTCAGS